MNKRHYEHTLPNIRGSLSNTYVQSILWTFKGDILNLTTTLIIKISREKESCRKSKSIVELSYEKSVIYWK